ncbi:hypothetical protein AQZ52_08565 [Novosphingobium fuchskuhlense]|uniref:Uncharacterized protein n=1 Tax=Novosphingobium fuchskuhlense TaxID=1117702 RepID=A0A124JUW4_9SPHN|nr:hypothetical protein [Novosphingobium fuchskuhlense]KUR71658.1 hypothetical protein AQZ52_08565 [Novosphingobium fuchskuhlense]
MQEPGAVPMTQVRKTLTKFPRVAGAVGVACAALFVAPTAEAQTAYDITLRSIAQPTITAASLDGRARQAALSIAPPSLENSPSMVPAVYDPTAGRFVSAIGGSRGAISVTSTGAVSVIISNQTSNVLVGSSATGVPLRSDAAVTTSTLVTAQQVTATSSSSR